MQRRGRFGRRLVVALALIGTVVILAAGTAGSARGQLGPSPTPVGTLVPGTHITYPPGWNLVAGNGTVLSGVSTLYTYQATDTAYQTLDGGTPLVSGNGYWAYFNVLTPAQILGPTPQTFTRPLPAGHYVLVGNPRESLVTVAGADVVYVYDQVAGYTPTTVLQPGQGAWAYSAAGGTLTFTNLAP